MSKKPKKYNKKRTKAPTKKGLNKHLQAFLKANKGAFDLVPEMKGIDDFVDPEYQTEIMKAIRPVKTAKNFWPALFTAILNVHSKEKMDELNKNKNLPVSWTIAVNLIAQASKGDLKTAEYVIDMSTGGEYKKMLRNMGSKDEEKTD